MTTTGGGIMELLHSPKNPVVSKSYFVLDTEDGLNNGFKRHAYQKIGKSSDTTIVHYIGDETVATAFPHRNRIKSTIHISVLAHHTLLNVPSNARQ